MLLAVAVLAAQQCAEAEAEAAEPPDNVLSYGLTHMWTSPILRYQLIAQGHPSLALLEAAVLSPGFACALSPPIPHASSHSRQRSSNTARSLRAPSQSCERPHRQQRF